MERAQHAAGADGVELPCRDGFLRWHFCKGAAAAQQHHLQGRSVADGRDIKKEHLMSPVRLHQVFQNPKKSYQAASCVSGHHPKTNAIACCINSKIPFTKPFHGLGEYYYVGLITLVWD